MGMFIDIVVICADLRPASCRGPVFPSPHTNPACAGSVCGLGWYRRGPLARRLDCVSSSGPTVWTNISPVRGWANGPHTGRVSSQKVARGPKVRANHVGVSHARI